MDRTMKAKNLKNWARSESLWGENARLVQGFPERALPSRTWRGKKCPSDG